jgi:hypothetical protein
MKKFNVRRAEDSLEAFWSLEVLHGSLSRVIAVHVNC